MGTRYQQYFELSVLFGYLLFEGDQILLVRSQGLLILQISVLDLSHAFALCLAFTLQSIVFIFQLCRCCLIDVLDIVTEEGTRMHF